MKVELRFTAKDAKTVEYFLSQRYQSKSTLASLIKKAVWTEVAAQAQLEAEEALAELNKEVILKTYSTQK